MISMMRTVIFTFGDEPITMEKYERIRDEMYMWMNSDSEFE